MKKYLLIVSACLFSLCFLSCEKDEEGKLPKEGEITFSFETKLAVLKATMADAAAIVVSIEDNTGNPIYSSEKVELYNINGEYISKPISFVPGAYNLTQYLVLDAMDNILYATPLEGSPKAYLVQDPLPIDFSIQKDVVTKVVPEVLSTEEANPEDFGYVTSSFDIVETFDFLIGVFIYNESIQNFEMTDASISIRGDDTPIYAGYVEALTNTITLRDGYANYEITIEKAGYETWVDTFTNAELKLYYSSEDEGPLEVVLFSAEDYGEIYITLDSLRSDLTVEWLTFYNPGVFTIDWGDGIIEPFIAHPQHTYATQGSYEIIISGNVDLITALVLGNQTYTKEIDITAAINLDMFVCEGSFDEIDLTNNSLLTILGLNGKFSDIDLSNLTDLTYLLIGSENITSLDISNQPLLESLLLYYTQLSSIDMTNNDNLIGFHLEDNAFTSGSLDSFIADLLSKVQANPRSGYIAIIENELPGPDGISDLETLRDDYGWTFSYSLPTKKINLPFEDIQNYINGVIK